uniref:Uncharacterized protein n=1 Tax=Rhizophora mucronata TaxID=61149 RepID=A0A2P2QUU9_RHIMU
MRERQRAESCSKSWRPERSEGE